MNLAFLNIGTQEMMLIILAALLLFGGKKLPELARGLGRGIRDFKDASEGIKKEISEQINNFEKEIDDVKTDLEKEPEVTVAEAQKNTVEDINLSQGDQENNVADKGPQFSSPEGTFEHKPYTTPTSDDYYSYGYNDNFANKETSESSKEVNVEDDIEKISAKETLNEENPNLSDSSSKA